MVKDSRLYLLGLDLHGTLLEPGELMRPELVEPVGAGLERLRDRVAIFLCTGNDLDFVKRKVPEPILQRIDGCVLETGCSLSLDNKTERVLTTAREREVIGELKAVLQKADLDEINYFAHRLTTISMFCHHPRQLFHKVDELVQKTPFYELVHVTYSSVAVDILPRGYNKAKGLLAVAKGKKTIGVADSMNDMALLSEADFALAPANLAPELAPLLAEGGREVIPIEGAHELLRGVVIVASKSETRGVLEIIGLLDRVIREGQARA